VQTCLEQGQSSAQIEAWLEKNPDSDPRKKAEEYMSRINRPVW
jgi:hypothetical protein